MDVENNNDAQLVVTFYQLWQNLRVLFRILFVVVNQYCGFPIYAVWYYLLYPLILLSPDLYWQLEGVLFHWFLTMIAYWSYSAGYYIVETGDSIDNLADEETLVLVNHQSDSDVPLLMQAFCSRPSLCKTLSWIIDFAFTWTPLHIVSLLHGHFFIHEGHEHRDETLNDLKNFLLTKFLPRKRKWLVLFPEGGFLRKQKELSQRYARAHNLPHLEYVLLPYKKAFQTIIKTLAPSTVKKRSPFGLSGSIGVETTGKLKYIIDMTIAYPNGVPLSFLEVVAGNVRPCHIRMHYKVYPIDELPHTSLDAMEDWLYKIYIEKNNMLGHYYKTGIWNPEKFAKKDINSTSKTGQISTINVLQSSITGLDVVDRVSNQHSRVFGDGTRPFEFWLDDRKSEAHCQFESDPWFASSASIVEDQCIYEPLSRKEWEALESSEKTVHLDLRRVLLIHLMFIGSTFAQIHVIGYLLQWCYIIAKESFLHASNKIQSML